MQLEENLKRLMDARNLSLARLSELTGVPKQTLHNWLCGADPKNVEQLRAVAKTFSLSIEELCFGEKTSSKKTIDEYEEEINTGVFEVVLRRVKK